MAGIKFDFIKICPHKPEMECSCRKPKVGLLEQELKNSIIKLSASYMVGDSITDMEFGKNIGLTTIQIVREKNSETRGKYSDFQINSITELLNIVL